MKKVLSSKYQVLREKRRGLALSLLKGFTLIELLVVISVLGLLAALLMSNIAGARERGRDAKRKSDLQQIKEALRMYHNDYDQYPATGSSGTIKGCGTVALPADCSWGGEFKRGQTSYMKELPKDPSSTDAAAVYYVYSQTSVDNFYLYALIENVSDQDITKSQTRCLGASPPAATNAYYVCAD